MIDVPKIQLGIILATGNTPVRAGYRLDASRPAMTGNIVRSRTPFL